MGGSITKNFDRWKLQLNCLMIYNCLSFSQPSDKTIIDWWVNNSILYRFVLIKTHGNHASMICLRSHVVNTIFLLMTWF